jgi:hypothetical protein
MLSRKRIFRSGDLLPVQIRAKLSHPNVFAYELTYLLLPQPAHLQLPLVLAHRLHSTAAQHQDSQTGTSVGDLTCSGQIRLAVPAGAKYPLS